MEKYKREDEYSYALGTSLTIEALKHIPEYVSNVYLSDKVIKNEQFSYLLDLCEKNNIEPIYDENVINKLSLKENCYCIGVFKKFEKKLNDNKHIVLYKFDDFGELGTILRSAVSFDFRDIVLVGSDIDYFDPRCVRASMGSIFHVNIIRYDSVENYMNDYDEHFYYPFVPHGGHELKELVAHKPYSVIIPQKYHGLDPVFKEGYYIKHNKMDEISLSSLSSIVFSYLYHQSSKS